MKTFLKSYPPGNDLKWWQLNGLKLSISFTVIGLCPSWPPAFHVLLLSISAGLIGGLFWLFHNFVRLFQIILLLLARPAFRLLLFLLHAEAAVSVGHDFLRASESAWKSRGCDRAGERGSAVLSGVVAVVRLQK